MKYIMLYCEARDRSVVCAHLHEIHGPAIMVSWHPGCIKSARHLTRLVRSHDPDKAFVYVTAPRMAMMAAMMANVPFGFVDHSNVNGPSVWHAKHCRIEQVQPKPEPAVIPATEPAKAKVMPAREELAVAVA